MKKLLAVLFFVFSTGIFAQEAVPQKYALVIGNGAYTGGLTKLANPVNDANDVAQVMVDAGEEEAERVSIQVRILDRLNMAAGAAEGTKHTGAVLAVPVM